ncbi:MAG: hypothetical protein LBM92_05265, partial [Opitutaceae bacterium]|nr:hypothetical protein [Opitutaceae bacterium]
MKTPLFLTKHVKRLSRAIFACAIALVFCPPLVYAQDIVVTEPSLSLTAALRENKNISLPEPPAFLKKMEARNSGDWGAPPTCAYAIITQYIDKDGTPGISLFYGTHRELLNAMPDGFEKQKFKPLKSPAARRFWYAVIYNPPAAAANAPDAEPRLLAVSPVEFSREVFEAVKESEKTVRGNARIDAKGKPAVSFVEFSREKFEAVRGREQTVWGNAQIDAKGKLAEYSLDPQYAYANAWKPAIDDALKQWKFAPARAGGKRVAATLRLPVRLPALPTKIFRGAADRRPAAGGDASYFEPALVDEDTVELPAYKVVGERILPPPESWLYTAIP